MVHASSRRHQEKRFTFVQSAHFVQAQNKWWTENRRLSSISQKAWRFPISPFTTSASHFTDSSRRMNVCVHYHRCVMASANGLTRLSDTFLDLIVRLTAILELQLAPRQSKKSGGAYHHDEFEKSVPLLHNVRPHRGFLMHHGHRSNEALQLFECNTRFQR